MVDGEIKSWLADAYRDAVKILTKNKATVKKLAEELLKRETLTGEEILEIVGKKTTKKTTVKKAKVAKK